MALKNYIAKSLYIWKKVQKKYCTLQLEFNLQHFNHIQVFLSSPSSRQVYVRPPRRTDGRRRRRRGGGAPSQVLLNSVSYGRSKSLMLLIQRFLFLFLMVTSPPCVPQRGLRLRRGGEGIDTRGRRGWEVGRFLNVIVEKHLVHTTTINFNS